MQPHGFTRQEFLSPRQCELREKLWRQCCRDGESCVGMQQCSAALRRCYSIQANINDLRSAPASPSASPKKLPSEIQMSPLRESLFPQVPAAPHNHHVSCLQPSTEPSSPGTSSWKAACGCANIPSLQADLAFEHCLSSIATIVQ